MTSIHGNKEVKLTAADILRTVMPTSKEIDQIENEAMIERQRYIKSGVCSKCGARSAEEAETKCRPSRDITDEYGCPGEGLWLESAMNQAACENKVR